MDNYLLLIPALLVGGIISTVAGGGLGFISILLGSLFFDIRTSIAMTSLLMVTVQFAKISHFYKYVRWDITKWYAIAGVPMSFIGGILLFYVPQRIPELGLSILCIIFVIIRITGVRPKVSTSKTALILSGGFNGLIGGMVGNAGMLRATALLSMGLSKEVMVGTSSMISFLMNFGKLTAYVPYIPWGRDLVILFAIAIPALFTGVWIGKRLLKYVNPELFEALLLCVILLGAVRLIFNL